jgi:hypothetical protein
MELFNGVYIFGGPTTTTTTTTSKNNTDTKLQLSIIKPSNTNRATCRDLSNSVLNYE